MFKIQGMFAFLMTHEIPLKIGGTFLVTGFLTGLSTFIFGVKPLFVEGSPSKMSSWIYEASEEHISSHTRFNPENMQNMFTHRSPLDFQDTNVLFISSAPQLTPQAAAKPRRSRGHRRAVDASWVRGLASHGYCELLTWADTADVLWVKAVIRYIYIHTIIHI